MEQSVLIFIVVSLFGTIAARPKYREYIPWTIKYCKKKRKNVPTIIKSE